MPAVFPGLDVARCGLSYRARVRVSPFFDLSETFADELDALAWGYAEVKRPRNLKDQLDAERRLPATAITRDEATQNGCYPSSRAARRPPTERPVSRQGKHRR